jgi:hypothetical protein
VFMEGGWVAQPGLFCERVDEDAYDASHEAGKAEGGAPAQLSERTMATPTAGDAKGQVKWSVGLDAEEARGLLPAAAGSSATPHTVAGGGAVVDTDLVAKVVGWSEHWPNNNSEPAREVLAELSKKPGIAEKYERMSRMSRGGGELDQVGGSDGDAAETDDSFRRLERANQEEEELLLAAGHEKDGAKQAVPAATGVPAEATLSALPVARRGRPQPAALLITEVDAQKQTTEKTPKATRSSKGQTRVDSKGHPSSVRPPRKNEDPPAGSQQQVKESGTQLDSAQEALTAHFVALKQSAALGWGALWGEGGGN